jgi:lipopolysaccharide/colanic/teichoic acid biosynthesis glycosyltransferase
MHRSSGSARVRQRQQAESLLFKGTTPGPHKGGKRRLKAKSPRAPVPIPNDAPPRVGGTFRERQAPSIQAPDHTPATVRPLVDPAIAEAFAREISAAGLEQPVGGWRRMLARLADILIAATALILTAPIMLLMILAVRLDSPGPAIFRQRRVGKGLEPFTLLKIRTLYLDAKERFPELYRYEFSPVQIKTLELRDLKTPDDPRVTRLGRWLRVSSLDELPNFWNLLKGDIALVGPRPELYECLKYYEGPQLLKFAVRPGVTGLAQVSGRNSNSFQQMIRWDIEYVRNRSLVLDVKISLLTVNAVLSRHGAW